MVTKRTSATLVLAGVALFVGMVVVSAATAPTIGATQSHDSSSNETVRTLVGSQGGGPGLHDYGSVYLLEDGEVAWRLDDADSYFDVTMLDNGSVMAGFMDSGYTDCGPYESPCTHTGFRIIDPGESPEVVSEFSFPVRTRANSEVHDVELLPSGEFLVSDMEYERIMTVRGGEITWQWNASSIYTDGPDDPTREDWLHINDVDHLGDDRYLVSVRNANQLVIVERGEGVVEIINEDPNPEDGRVGDPSVLNRQHNPQWLNKNTILVADSENGRVVELQRGDGDVSASNGSGGSSRAERSDGEWTVGWELSEAEGVAFAWPRDADRLENGNTLITDSANQRIVEVNESGETVWSVRTQYIPYEAERLPEGETVGGQPYSTDAGSPAGVASGDVPGISFLLQVLRTSMPLPFWVTELHLVVTLVSLGLVSAGLGTAARSAFAARRRN
ncbi:arylsulfotransferase family protein [Haloprofundus salinisoli]|uniref:arylsulfotransferase family protein n=1 Tax=Haloprofundus salinisoli TaxID=2876193 RepID=UPI001CCE3660|nr:arylsulfotransferase family protein [Haloprofundus salinisoli]